MTPRDIANNLLRELSDRGQIIEGGWRAMELLSLKDKSELQRSEMRKAFFFGAQHLFGSIMNILDPGTEPTEQDVNRITLIHEELKAFLKEIDQQT